MFHRDGVLQRRCARPARAASTYREAACQCTNAMLPSQRSSRSGIMIKLYDNAFSPFARKVRMVLEFKGLEFETIDGLLKSNHESLKSVNERIEVPTLVDDGIVIVNSADIVAYLEYRYRERSIYP